MMNAASSPNFRSFSQRPNILFDFYNWILRYAIRNGRSHGATSPTKPIQLFNSPQVLTFELVKSLRFPEFLINNYGLHLFDFLLYSLRRNNSACIYVFCFILLQHVCIYIDRTGTKAISLSFSFPLLEIRLVKP